MDSSFLLMLSNLLHLQNHLDPTSTTLLSDSSTTTTSSSPAPLLFFAIASVLSYAASSLRSSSTSSSSPSSPHSHTTSPLLLSPSHSMDPLARDAQWRASYGLSYSVFSSLLDQLKPHLLRSTLPLPPDAALSMLLSRLSHSHSPKTLAARYSIDPYLVSKTTNFLTRLLSTKLYPLYVRFPAGHRLLQTISSFKDLTGLPNMCGAIDGSPIKINRLPVSINPSAYKCRYNYLSVLLQAVADQRKIFWDVCVKVPGGSDDATHFRESLLYNRLFSGEILQDSAISVRGHHVRPYIVGDWSYPLLSFLLTPFSSSRTGTPAQNAFDSALMRGRATVEQAIGLLKGRWRILRDLNVGLNHSPQTIVACCVLHNMCQLAGDPEPTPWMDPKEMGPPARALDNEKSDYYFGESLRQAVADDLQERQQRHLVRDR